MIGSTCCDNSDEAALFPSKINSDEEPSSLPPSSFLGSQLTQLDEDRLDRHLRRRLSSRCTGERSTTSSNGKRPRSINDEIQGFTMPALLLRRDHRRELNLKGRSHTMRPPPCLALSSTDPYPGDEPPGRYISSLAICLFLAITVEREERESVGVEDDPQRVGVRLIRTP